MTTSTKRPDGDELNALANEIEAARNEFLNTYGTANQAKLKAAMERLLSDDVFTIIKALRVAAATPTNESPAPQAEAWKILRTELLWQTECNRQRQNGTDFTSYVEAMDKALIPAPQAEARKVTVRTVSGKEYEVDAKRVFNLAVSALLSEGHKTLAQELMDVSAAVLAPQPPVEGLRAIADYLYEETTKLDAPISMTACLVLAKRCAALASPSLTAGAESEGPRCDTCSDTGLVLNSYTGEPDDCRCQRRPAPATLIEQSDSEKT